MIVRSILNQVVAFRVASMLWILGVAAVVCALNGWKPASVALLALATILLAVSS